MEDFDKELLHYAKGQTKKNAKYKSRKMVNGRWVYDYGRNHLAIQKAANEYKNNPAHPDSVDVNNYVVKSEQTRPDYNQATRQYHQYIRDRYTSATETSKRKQQSALAAKQRSYASKGKSLIKKYIVGEPGKVYPVNSAKEKAAYELIRRKNMSKGRKFIEDYVIGHEGKVKSY